MMYDVCTPEGACTLTATIVGLVGFHAEGLGHSAMGVAEVFPWFWPVMAAVVGAVMASLSGLVVDRLPRVRGWNGEKAKGLSLSSPPSHCEACREPVPKLALIPVVGWFIAGGACSACGERVPMRYPLIEAASAFASLAVVAWMGPTWPALATLIAIWTLILASWIDWMEHEIPDFITFPLFFLGLVASPFEPDAMSRILGAVLGASLMWGSFRLTSSVGDVDAMSYGDVTLAAALCAWLGLCGVPVLMLATCGVYLAYAVPLRWRGEVWVPMGPALAVGFLLVAATGLRLGS